MKNQPIVVTGALLVLCLLLIGIVMLQNREVPGLLIGAAGVLCGVLLKCVADRRRNSGKGSE